MKVVLFIGAGFSRAWGLPVMNEFFDYARRSQDIANEDKNFLRDLQRQAQSGEAMVSVGRNNLEEILSYCLVSEKFNAEYPNGEHRDFDQLCRILRDVYRHVNMELWHDNGGHLRSFRKLLGLSQSDRTPPWQSVTFVTTNYDVMIEWLMCQLSLRCALPGSWKPAGPLGRWRGHSSALYEPEGNGPMICKLHGSLNWSIDNSDPEGLQVENTVQLRSFEHEHIKGGTIRVPLVQNRDFKMESRPLIVPPTLFKMQTHRVFRDIWNDAGSALREADKLCFIGFSFPESDTYIKYFLAANLHGNVDFGSIDIIDPHATDIVKRLRDSGYGPHFTDRLRAIDSKWEESEYSIVN